MADPLLAEFCRAAQLDPSFVRRCQREFRQRIQPQLDRLEELNQRILYVEDERDALRRENAALAAQLVEAKKPKRRGRPPKVKPAEVPA